ncbi:MAG: ferredoxin Fer [Haloarculaceae archaeon]
MASPYDVLGIEPPADDDAIRAAYRERVKAVHPDHGGTVEEFRRVRAAYERLQRGDDAAGEWDDEATTAAEPDDARPDRRDGDAATADGSAEDEPTTATVEYLNYDVLADYGWSLADEDLFAKAAAADLDRVDYGAFEVRPGESLLSAAERTGHAWPFACRGGACSNCAVAVREGELPPPASHVLPPSLIDRGIRLSCSVTPETDRAKVVYNVKHLPGVNELLLPASRFEKTYASD